MVRLIGAYSVALAALAASSPAWSQSVAESIQARVKHGQRVSITDDQGQEINGRISALTADGLTMMVDGQAAEVPYDRIVRIDRPTDSLANGALIGLGVGVALGLAAVATDDPSQCASCGETSTGDYVAGTLLLGGLGTAVGVGIDALIHRDREIYRRGGRPQATVAPILGHGVHGAVATLTW